jgi:hypothetical protein
MRTLGPSLESIKKTRWFEYFLYVLILCGIIIGTITNSLQKSASNTNQILQTTIVGFMTAIIGLLFLMAVSIKFHNMKLGEVNQPIRILSSYIMYSLPSVITIGILLYICVVLLIYRDQIIGGRVADEYYTYSTAANVLLGIQSMILIYHLYKQMLSIHNGKSINFSTTTSYSIYILGVLNIILVGISQVILKFFSTDG